MDRDRQIEARKRQLREEVLRYRSEQADKLSCSRQIRNRLIALPEYPTARTLSIYVATPVEVQTQELISGAWNDGKEVAVPCCIRNELRMFHLSAMAELAPRTLGILEPRKDLWPSEERWLDVSRIDLFVVPGVAFDSSGGRLGYGKGYYDRLLANARPDAAKIAIAFECQVIDRVPMTARDSFVDCVITEKRVYHRDRPTGEAIE
ncbi:MAG: 5-formyltetrahydrofolate cyclo-ligase [Pirellulaceae bacterium]